MSYPYIFVQSGYRETFLIYVRAHNEKIVLSMDNKRVSGQLLPTLDHLLRQENSTLADLSFIGAYQGPAPFTTLRTSLTMVNGLGFASGKPLVPVDGLRFFIDEYRHVKVPVLCVMLQAFCDDIYFAVFDKRNDHYEAGYENIDHFLERFNLYLGDQHALFLGNGVSLYTDRCSAIFGARYELLDIIPQSLSPEYGARAALSLFDKDHAVQEIMPLYLKPYSAQISLKP